MRRRKLITYHNAWIRYDFNEKFHAVASADFGTQELLVLNNKGIFTMCMIIAGYQVREKISLAARAENMQDNDELLVNTSGLGFDLSIYSLAASYVVSENAKLSIEGKYGKNDSAIFFSADAIASENYLLLAGGLAVRFTK